MDLKEKMERYKLKCKALGVTPLDYRIEDGIVYVRKNNVYTTEEIIFPNVDYVIDKFGMSLGEDTYRVVIDKRLIGLSKYAFCNCWDLEEIIFKHSNIRNIPKGCFLESSSLEYIDIGDNIETIGEKAFRKCIKLVRFNRDEYGVLRLNKNVRELGVRCFERTGFKKVIIDGNIDRIPNFAFAHCSELEEVIINGKVRMIDEGAFQYCNELKRVVIKNEVENLSDKAFLYCDKLRELRVKGM